MTDELSYSDSERIDNLIERERSPHREPSVRITGLMVQYYHVCRRELWFMSRGIDIDRGAANIRRGSYVDEHSYRNKRRSFSIDGRISLDLLDDGDVMEVKVSSALEEPPRMQLLYYLWYLDRIHEVEKSGVLAYPKERSRESIALTEDTALEVEETLRGIIDTVEADSPPDLEKKPYCHSCLYQDICWL
ncbi:CRISPR-associated protein Cas4 [Halosolutus gelatinilyticus]|uniref:CRISPR-associated protein Cas4 n=1 Tax=Halosolutus gelatinilyticus TaxID=2931975 RepID=UPI001FF1C2FB|nr:CRISPR-associated protein Cas4 [Halosolutus gelatinilyticus]